MNMETKAAHGERFSGWGLLRKCTKCGEVFGTDSFYRHIRALDGLSSWCKYCERAQRSQHHAKNRDKRRAYAAVRQKAAGEEAKSAKNERARVAHRENPDRYRPGWAAYARKRREADPSVRLRARISKQLRTCLSTGKGGASSEALLGFTIAELREHLQRQFLKGMGWENMKLWHIDHIVPLSSFTITGPDDPELRRAWALTNLRPLWAADNIRKHAKRELLL